MMLNFIIPAHPLNQPSSDVEALRQRYAKALNSLRDLQRYHDALELIRDHSSDLTAVALANNVLMGVQTDFAFIFFPNRPKHQ
jgi:hypothetical protein